MNKEVIKRPIEENTEDCILPRYRCPHCEEIMINWSYRIPYCEHCGGKIDWSEGNE